MGSLKAALTAIFNTNTYTSSTSGIASKKIPVTESNGLPSGQIGMSDLASVLGVVTAILIGQGTINANADLNEITDVGSYRCGSSSVATSLAHSPVELPFVLWVFGNNQAAYRLQMIFCQNGIYYRNTPTNNWVKI